MTVRQKNLSTLESNKLRKYFLSRETEIKWNSTVTAIKKVESKNGTETIEGKLSKRINPLLFATFCFVFNRTLSAWKKLGLGVDD